MKPKPSSRKAQERERYHRLKLKAFMTVGKGVLRCSVPDCLFWALDLLHLDHIENDGHIHRGSSRASGAVLYRWVLRHPKTAAKKLQILCANHDRMKQTHGSVERIMEVEEQAYYPDGLQD